MANSSPTESEEPCKFSGDEIDLLDARGLIPGPFESASSFATRARSAIGEIAPDRQPSDAPESLHSALDQLEATYSTRPIWPRITWDFSSARGWQLGCWEELGASCSRISLKGEFARGPHWGYSASEVLAHELAHAARCAFPADLLDEYLCYGLSPRKYRRLLGPLLASPRLVTLTIISAGTGLFSLIAAVLPNSGLADLGLQGALWSQILVGLCLTERLARIALFWRAEGVLERFDRGKGRWWLFRLTQKEACAIGLKGRVCTVMFPEKGPRRELFRAQRAFVRLESAPIAGLRIARERGARARN